MLNTRSARIWRVAIIAALAIVTASCSSTDEATAGSDTTTADDAMADEESDDEADEAMADDEITPEQIAEIVSGLCQAFADQTSPAADVDTVCTGAVETVAESFTIEQIEGAVFGEDSTIAMELAELFEELLTDAGITVVTPEQ